jgi:hypothetical protein
MQLLIAEDRNTVGPDTGSPSVHEEPTAANTDVTGTRQIYT